MFFNWKKKKQPDYTCSECGEVHSGWPALAYTSPTNYNTLSEEDQNNLGELSEDFCVIDYGDQISRFIRVSLTQQVNDSKEDLDYGLWVSLSEKSFKDYHDNYNNTDHEVEYFGWLCNQLPDYEDTLSIPTTVVTQPGNSRPRIYPHQSHDHPFVKDFYKGVTAHEAQKRVDAMMQRDE